MIIMIYYRLLRLLLLFSSGATATLYCFAFSFGTGSSLISSRHATSQVHLHATTISASSWKPCVQPRFDDFANCIVGPWITLASPTERLDVKDVMRSCGGAVQGIRELSISVASQSQDGSEETIYLNRSDGGFVYIDDGSYSFGPEKWDLSTTEEAIVMTSLAFTGNHRGLVTANLSRECGILPKSTVLELFRPISSVTENIQSLVDNVDKETAVTIKWKRIQRARMPNPSQPWTLARAKWEQQTLTDEFKSEYNLSGNGALSCVESNGKSNNFFMDILDADDDSLNVNMLAVCHATAVARSTIRSYDSKGLLKSVAFLEGRVGK